MVFHSILPLGLHLTRVDGEPVDLRQWKKNAMFV